MSWLRPLGSATNPKSVEFQITNPQRDFEGDPIELACATQGKFYKNF